MKRVCLFLSLSWYTQMCVWHFLRSRFFLLFFFILQTIFVLHVWTRLLASEERKRGRGKAVLTATKRTRAWTKSIVNEERSVGDDDSRIYNLEKWPSIFFGCCQSSSNSNTLRLKCKKKEEISEYIVPLFFSSSTVGVSNKRRNTSIMRNREHIRTFNRKNENFSFFSFTILFQIMTNTCYWILLVFIEVLLLSRVCAFFSFVFNYSFNICW